MPLANALHHIKRVLPVGKTGCGKPIAGPRVIRVVVSVIAVVAVRESAEIPAQAEEPVEARAPEA